jgi:hypothetical protein
MRCLLKATIYALVGALLLPGVTSLADIAHQKFARIETGKLAPGTRIDFSIIELNAWAADEARLYAPGAARNIKVELTEGGATGSMLLDFLKLRQSATGEQPGWLAKTLFSGERPVTVKGRFESGSRRARVMVDRVEVSGVAIEGTALEFLIQNWLRPTFPDVKVNQWFELAYRVERFTVTPSGTSVFIGN